MPVRIAVLASGRGSNARALIDHQRALGERSAGEVSLILSDRADAAVLDLAREREVKFASLDPPVTADGLLSLLDAHGIGMLVLAGFLRLVPVEVVRAYAGRVINIHPALLPSFGGKGMYGRRVHEAVLAAGSKVSGATVHFVDEEYDRGAIIAQWPVPVRGDDTPETLAKRVLAVEHLLLPRSAEAVAAGRIRLGEGGRVVGVFDAVPATAAFTLVPADDDVLGRQIEAALA